MEIHKGQRLPLASLVTADKADYSGQRGRPLIGRVTSVDFARIKLSAGQKLPEAIDRLVCTAAVGGPGLMRQLQSGYLRCVVGGKEQALYDRLLDEFPSWLKEAGNRRIIN